MNQLMAWVFEGCTVRIPDEVIREAEKHGIPKIQFDRRTKYHKVLQLWADEYEASHLEECNLAYQAIHGKKGRSTE